MNRFMKSKKSKIAALFIGIIVIASCIVIKNQGGNNILAQIQFDLLKFQIENQIIDLENLSDEEYIEISLKVSELCVKKDGPKSENEHYFRNLFSRSPNTLSEMVEIITEDKNDLFGWKLLSPEKSVYHMYGTDGEYNLKFISHDGHFEVVYNKNGEKLTEYNEPFNMGTFNYASEDDYDNHLGYDMLPYFKWNNTKQIASEMEMEPEEISENEDAMKRYKEYEELLRIK